MSHSRVPFEEAVKRLRISCIPHSVLKRLALFLDTHNEANWEFLAEVLDISSLETQWLKETVIHSRHGSPTFRLFEQYLVKADLTLESFIQALEKIRNLACIRVLTEDYNNGVFDRALMELNGICNSTAILHRPVTCVSTHRCQSPLTSLHSAEFQREFLSKVYNCDPGNASCSSGSTYNSLDGAVGDSISYTQLDSYESGEFVPKFPVPMNIALCLGEGHLPSLGGEDGCKGLYAGNGVPVVNRTQDVPLDLSSCYVKAEPKIKEEHHHNGCCGGFELQRRQDVCAGHHTRCPHAAPAQHRPLKCDIKVEEGVAPVYNRSSPVTKERKMENGRRENPDCAAGKGSDVCCFCLSRSRLNDPTGTPSTEATAICMREPSPGSAQHHPSKRVTDPLSKEELELLEKEKQQTKNPDGTSPVRNTGSSYAVLQQKPFRKDSRSVRVFVTYSDDSKKHMRKVMQLCECLKNNNFSVSIDVRENHLLSQDKMGWFDKRFKVADYVLILISPKYYSDVTDLDDSIETQQDESTLNTLYIHRCMQAEYMMNKCLNKRFVPVLMPGSTKEHVPYWLKNTTIYLWPDQYKNLFFYMMYPAQVISQFVRREQSAKTPTVTKTNH